MLKHKLMLQIVIVEDEIRSREFLRDILLEHCKEIEIAGLAGDVAEAVKTIRELQPDLVFMDIELQTGTGFDVLEQIKDLQPTVIFTTAYDHYAIKAIKFSAVDYLLKPIDVEELKLAVSKIQEKASGDTQQQTLQMLMQNLKQLKGNNNPTITLSLADGYEFVPVREIIRLEAAGAYTNFFLKTNKKIMVSKNLKEYESMLTDHDFMRVHNSHIINLGEVKRMLKTDGGYAIMSDDARIVISPKKKEDFIRLMMNRNL
jgi:two-component system LytT family response regulator